MNVFKIHGTKWHLSPNNDNPAWPIFKKEVDKYRLTIRKVDVKNGDSGWGYYCKYKRLGITSG